MRNVEILTWFDYLYIKNTTMKTRSANVNEIHTTDKVKRLHSQGWTKQQIADEAGITRQTLSTRVKRHNWKKGEIEIIDRL